MFKIEDEFFIYATRGDAISFFVECESDGNPYTFEPGDIVRFKVFEKKACENVVLEKCFVIEEATTRVNIVLNQEDTTIGDVISKPKDYWYEIEMNPFTNPQTIVAYDDEGPKVFRLFPEGRENEAYVPDDEETEYQDVDSEFSSTSKRPIENRSITRAFLRLEGLIEDVDTKATIANSSEKYNRLQDIARVETALQVERARIDNFGTLAAGSTTGDAELIDGRVDNTGGSWSVIGNNIRNVGSLAELIAKAVRFTLEKIDTTIINGWVNTDGEYISNASSGDNHKCVMIDVNPGEHYLIYSEYGWGMPDAVAKKSDGTSLRNYHTSQDAGAINDFDEIITIPDGATQLVVNCMSDNLKPLTVAKITGAVGQVTPHYLDNALSSVRSDSAIVGENLITSVRTAYGLKFGEEFQVENGDTQFSVGECSVTEGKCYRVKAGGSFLCNPYIFYDDNDLIAGDLVSAPDSEYREYDVVLMAPPSATKLKVSNYGGNPPEVYEVTGFANSYSLAGLKWVCLGDSLTEVNSRTTKRYYDYISEKTGIETVNMGVGGTGYKRGEDNSNAFYQRISDVPTDADVVTIFGSGNDLKFADSLGLPIDTGTDTICGCINTTIDNLFEIHPTVQMGIISPTPWVYHQPSDDGAMARYADALKAICERRGIPFLDLFRCSGFRPNESEYRELVFSKDDGNGVHPNELGHKIIASRVKVFLDSLIS